MSERGVFAVDRGIFDHEAFADEPFTQREAWIWLVAQAAWRPRRRRVGSVTIDLERGQLAHSLRFMAQTWQWSEPRVRRFLTRMKTVTMIDATTDAGITVITICNYSKYQRVSLPDDADNDAPTDAAATQQRRKEEDKEYRESISPSLRSGEIPNKRGQRLPENWQPSADDADTAVKRLGQDRAAAELDKFRDYWRAQPGQRGVKLDWDATWRNWVRNAGETPRGSRGPPPREQVNLREMAARWRNGSAATQDQSRPTDEGRRAIDGELDLSGGGGLREGPGGG